MSRIVDSVDCVFRPYVSFITDDAIHAAVINDQIIPMSVPEPALNEQIADYMISHLDTQLRLFGYNSSLSVSSHILQLCKRQDEVYTCETMLNWTEYVCGAVFDGHGSDMCINAIRRSAVPIKTLMTYCLDPISHIHDMLQQNKYIDIHSGSTANYARLSLTSVDCASVGDSSTLVFINGFLVYDFVPHNMKNPAEVARLAEKGVVLLQDSYMKLLGENRIIQATDGARAHFTKSGLRLVPTMSLGHKNVTGMSIEYKHIDFEETDSVRVVMMSDGVRDMLYLDGLNDNIAIRTMTAEQLVGVANERYRQSWTMVHNGKDYANQKIPADQWDDCSVVILSK